jgi:hypothetical protein
MEKRIMQGGRWDRMEGRAALLTLAAAVRKNWANPLSTTQIMTGSEKEMSCDE